MCPVRYRIKDIWDLYNARQRGHLRDVDGSAKQEVVDIITCSLEESGAVVSKSLFYEDQLETEVGKKTQALMESFHKKHPQKD